MSNTAQANSTAADLQEQQDRALERMLELQSSAANYDRLSIYRTNGMVDSQWYLGTGYGENRSGTNVLDVWSAFGGSGIKIGIVDQGFDTGHSDLVDRFDLSLSYDTRDTTGATSITPDSLLHRHGTAVAGVIGASISNESGIVGVAPDATLAGFYLRLGSGGSSRAEIASLLNAQVNVDVSNNSWIMQSSFSDNFKLSAYTGIAAALDHAVTEGRNGLGTNIVFAAGNDRQYAAGSLENDGDNTNYHNLTNSRKVITVGASDIEGKVTSFSTPGASLLTVAPGIGILTTASDDADGDRTNDFYSVSGTSFAAPIVSGIVALMLEANPALGYRDVQDILALSARKTDFSGTHWQENGAKNWNGGGNYFSHDLGFGLVDARAAVALAESWTGGRTGENEASLALGASVASPIALVTGEAQTFDIPAGVEADDFVVSWVEVNVNIAHSAIGDLRVVLRSPAGTESILVDRPGQGTSIRDDINFVLTSNAHRGEAGSGNWTLVIEDQGNLGAGRILDYAVTLYGDRASGVKEYVYTDDFALLGNEDSVLAIDGSGEDTLNLAAVSGDLTASLAAGSDIVIGGRMLHLSVTAEVDNLLSGDGNDTLSGNGLANRLFGGRGNDQLNGLDGNDRLEGARGDDRLHGGEGDDTLVGGVGVNTLDGGQGDDVAIFSTTYAEAVVALVNGEVRVATAEFFDRLTNVETLRFLDRDVAVSSLYDLTDGTDPIDDDTSDVLPPIEEDTDATDPEPPVDETTDPVDETTDETPETDVEVPAPVEEPTPQPVYAPSDFRWFVASFHTDQVINDLVEQRYLAAYGGAGNDVFNASNANYAVTLFGNGGADRLIGGRGNDYLYVDADDLEIDGGDGFDYALIADTRATTLNLAALRVEGGYGGTGDDTIDASGVTRAVALWGNAGADSLTGGAGNDYIYFDAADRQISGGAGFDYAIAWTNDAVRLTLHETGFEGAYGGAGNDHFDASGMTQNTSLWGNGGADTLIAGAGNDYLYVDGQDTRIDGGAGYDWAIIGDQVGAVIRLGESNLEGAVGWTGNDILDASSSSANVRMFGGSGADTLIAGRGNDEMRGDGGADVFIFRASEMSGAHRDYVMDLSGAQGDQIVLVGVTTDQISTITSDYGLGLSIDLGDAQHHQIVFVGASAAQIESQLILM